jgi:4-hydroxybenzoate polyprenyltransferase
LYSSRYQKIPLAGNFVIAFLLAFVVLLVWLFEFFSLRDEPIVFANMLNSFSLINMFVWSYAAIAFLASFLREIIKDIEDTEGDSVAAYSTVPLRYGFKTSKRSVLSLSIVLALVLLWAAYQLFKMNLLPLAIFVILILFPMSVLVISRIIKSREAKDYHYIGNLLKIFIFSGILSMQLFYLSF